MPLGLATPIFSFSLSSLEPKSLGMIILTIILVQVLCCHSITKITRNGINGAMFVTLRVYFDSFSSGRAKSRCGGVLAVIFSDFYRQHPFGFQALRTTMHQISLTLMSSTSFGACMISGTKHTKLSQNGRNPRPTGLAQAGRPTPVQPRHATPR